MVEPRLRRWGAKRNGKKGAEKATGEGGKRRGLSVCVSYAPLLLEDTAGCAFYERTFIHHFEPLNVRRGISGFNTSSAAVPIRGSSLSSIQKPRIHSEPELETDRILCRREPVSHSIVSSIQTLSPTDRLPLPFILTSSPAPQRASHQVKCHLK